MGRGTIFGQPLLLAAGPLWHQRICMQPTALVVLSVLVASVSEAQNVLVTGRLIDGHGAGIALAEVKVNRTRVATNDFGQFAVRIDAGKVNIEVKRLGYMQSKMALRLMRDTTIEIVMLPNPGQLRTVTVTERAVTGLTRLGFFDRQEQAKRGFLNGTFITPEDITKRNPSAVSQMLGNVQGVSLQNSAGRLIPTAHDGMCAMTIFLDGAQINNSKGQQGKMSAFIEMERDNPSHVDGPQAGRIADYGGIDLVMSAQQLLGIEVYPRAGSAPLKYQSLTNNCGMILLWTKDGSEREARRR
jgi:hypothetical protein